MKLSQKQKIVFIDNLSSLLNSWIPVIQALDIIAFQSKNKKIDKVLEIMKSYISAGENFFKVALKLQSVFNVFDAAMIEAWEATWQVWKAFEIIVQKEEKEYDLKKKVKQALIYPIAIVIVTFAMLTVIMTYVIPKIKWIYKDANVNLPGLTSAIIDISDFFVANIVFIIITILVLILIVMQAYKKVPKFKFEVDKNVLRIPIFWEIIKKKILVHFADFLSILLLSGITINKSLLIIKNAMDNSYYSKEVENILEKVKAWMTISSAMWVEVLESVKKEWKKEQRKVKLSPAFPIEMSTSVKIWEQTWSLARMLQKTSTRYTKEIDNIVKNLSTLLEPIIIVVIWVIVWTIIMAILLPFLNMANVVK